MRIVAGELGGRPIEAPSGEGTRPTTDRVREAVFSSLYSRIGDLSAVDALDAFAGSGALGIEALSRGARSCTFVERDSAACKVIKRNLSALGIGPAAARVCRIDVLDVSQRASHLSGGPYQLVFLDPPYAMPVAQVRDLLAQLADGFLTDDCIIVYEHAGTHAADVRSCFEDNGCFAPDAQKRYGKVGVTYLRRTDR